MLCLFVVASETAIRKAEGTGNQGRNGLTFASLTYKIRGTLYRIITRALLAVMGVGDGVYLAHGVAKNDPLGSFFAATPSYLPWRAVGRCACRELAALDLAAAVAPGAREATPLFGPAVGEFFTEAQVEAVPSCSASPKARACRRRSSPITASTPFASSSRVRCSPLWRSALAHQAHVPLARR